MIQSRTITDFSKKILGYIETDTSTGNKTAMTFSRKIVGYYNKSADCTTDFSGRIVGYGDHTSALIMEEAR